MASINSWRVPWSGYLSFGNRKKKQGAKSGEYGMRNQNQPITSGFWDIWGYEFEKWGFSLLSRLCTGRKNFFLFFFLKCHNLALLFPFKMSYQTVTSDFFFTKIRPYQVLTFIRTTLWAFTLTLWCIPFCIWKFILVLILDIESTILEMEMSILWPHFRNHQLRNPRVRVFRERNRLIS